MQNNILSCDTYLQFFPNVLNVPLPKYSKVDYIHFLQETQQPFQKKNYLRNCYVSQQNLKNCLGNSNVYIYR